MQSCSRVDPPVVEDLHYGDNIERINPARTRPREDGDQRVLLQVERPGVHRERPSCQRNSHDFCRKSCSHQPPDREDGDLGAYRRYGDEAVAVGEELVQE